MIVPPPETNADLGEWYFVWEWWPVPRFLLPLLGADGCIAFVESLREYGVANRILVSFALAIEHRQQSVTCENDLRHCLAKICAPDYDFTDAKSLGRAVDRARWETLADRANNPTDSSQTANDLEAASREPVARTLPSGRDENIALMRVILARHRDKLV